MFLIVIGKSRVETYRLVHCKKGQNVKRAEACVAAVAHASNLYSIFQFMYGQLNTSIYQSVCLYLLKYTETNAH